MTTFKNELIDLIERIDEGVSNLKSRTNFEILDFKEIVPFIEMSLFNFKSSNYIQSDWVRGLLSKFHNTAIPKKEGSDAYNVSIWDANIEARGTMTTLEDLFSELEEKYRKMMEGNTL